MIENGKDGDVTELMTPVRALLRLEDDEARTAASKNRLRHETTAGRYRFNLSLCQGLGLASKKSRMNSKVCQGTPGIASALLSGRERL